MSLKSKGSSLPLTLDVGKPGLSMTKLALIISGLFSANVAASTFDFSGATTGTTLTTNADGVTATMTVSSGEQLNVTPYQGSNFAYPSPTPLSSSTWTISFSSPISITQFRMMEITNKSFGENYVFTPNNGTAVSIQDTDSRLGDYVEILNPTDWVSVTSLTFSSTYSGIDRIQIGISDIVFTVAATDTTAPTFDSVNSTPNDNATNVSVSNNIVIDFDENIALGSGNITIRNVTDSSDFEVFSVTTESDGTTTSPSAGRIGISGDKIYLNPTSNLTGNRTYAIRIDTSAVDDIAGNSFAGISDDTTFNFSTANTAPVVD